MTKRTPTTRNQITIVAVLLAVLLTVVPRTGRAASEHRLTKKELKALIASAKTPEDHQKIAAYYREEAKRLHANAKEHADLAEVYAKHPPFPAMGAKHGDTVPGVGHCRKWADLENQEADEADALAAQHEDMAKAVH